MKFDLRVLFAAALVIGLSRPGHAQAFYGPGGLFVHPTAFFPKQGTLKLSASYLYQSDSEASNQYIPVTLSYAVSDRFLLGGIGVDHLVHKKAGVDEHEEDHHEEEHHHDHTHQHAGEFAGYQFLSDGPSHPAFAIIGAYRHQDAFQTNISGVMSHRFLRPDSRTLLIGHLGLKYGRNDEGQSGVAPYIGIEIPFARDFRLIGEAGSRISFEPSSSHGLGVVWQKPGAISIGTGIVNLGRSKYEGFYWGVGYPLGGGS